MKFPVLLLALLSSALLAAEQKNATPAGGSNEVAVIQTSEGDMVIEFWSDAAPQTIANFKKLARSGFTTALLSIASSKAS